LPKNKIKPSIFNSNLVVFDIGIIMKSPPPLPQRGPKPPSKRKQKQEKMVLCIFEKKFLHVKPGLSFRS
jgi:hypothetical protein